MSRRFSSRAIYELEQAEIEALEAALDAYEAIRLTPGPERRAAELAIKPLLTIHGCHKYEGRVYHWSYEDDSLVRHIPRFGWSDTNASRRLIASCAPAMRRKGTTFSKSHGGTSPRLWHTCYHGRAI